MKLHKDLWYNISLFVETNQSLNTLFTLSLVESSSHHALRYTPISMHTHIASRWNTHNDMYKFLKIISERFLIVECWYIPWEQVEIIASLRNQVQSLKLYSETVAVVSLFKVLFSFQELKRLSLESVGNEYSSLDHMETDDMEEFTYTFLMKNGLIEHSVVEYESEDEIINERTNGQPEQGIEMQMNYSDILKVDDVQDVNNIPFEQCANYTINTGTDRGFMNQSTLHNHESIEYNEDIHRNANNHISISNVDQGLRVPDFCSKIPIDQIEAYIGNNCNQCSLDLEDEYEMQEIADSFDNVTSSGISSNSVQEENIKQSNISINMKQIQIVQQVKNTEQNKDAHYIEQKQKRSFELKLEYLLIYQCDFSFLVILSLIRASKKYLQNLTLVEIYPFVLSGFFSLSSQLCSLESLTLNEVYLHDADDTFVFEGSFLTVKHLQWSSPTPSIDFLKCFPNLETLYLDYTYEELLNILDNVSPILLIIERYNLPHLQEISCKSFQYNFQNETLQVNLSI